MTETRLEAYRYTAGGTSFILAQWCRPMTEDRPTSSSATLPVGELSYTAHSLHPWHTDSSGGQ